MTVFIVVHLPIMSNQVRIWIILLISFEACLCLRLGLTMIMHTGADTTGIQEEWAPHTVWECP